MTKNLELIVLIVVLSLFNNLNTANGKFIVINVNIKKKNYLVYLICMWCSVIGLKFLWRAWQIQFFFILFFNK